MRSPGSSSTASASSPASEPPDQGADFAADGSTWEDDAISIQEDTMGKTGRKRRSRRKKNANHGKRPNS